MQLFEIIKIGGLIFTSLPFRNISSYKKVTIIKRYKKFKTYYDLK